MAGWQWQLEGGLGSEVSGSTHAPTDRDDPAPAPAPTEPTRSKDRAARFEVDGYVELPNFYSPAEVRFGPACEPVRVVTRAERMKDTCFALLHTVSLLVVWR